MRNWSLLGELAGLAGFLRVKRPPQSMFSATALLLIMAIWRVGQLVWNWGCIERRKTRKGWLTDNRLFTPIIGTLSRFGGSTVGSSTMTDSALNYHNNSTKVTYLEN